jgi:hypothetical protein
MGEVVIEKEPHPETPPSPDEMEQARLLAEALGSGSSEHADPKSLAVVRLFESLSEDRPADELARMRTRKLLAARASRLRLLRAAARFAAAAALVLFSLSAVLLWRSLGRPSLRVLDQREEAARAAVAALGVSQAGDLADARLHSRIEDLRSERFASAARKERMTALLGRAAEAHAPDQTRAPMKAATPTPDSGGTV